MEPEGKDISPVTIFAVCAAFIVLSATSGMLLPF